MNLSRRLDKLEGSNSRILVVAAQAGREDDVPGFLAAQGIEVGPADQLIVVRRFCGSLPEPMVIVE